MKSEALEPEPKSFCLSKYERLRSRKTIQGLFSSKSSDFIYPFKFINIPNEQSIHHQILVSVPKKIFKRSVDRHLISRRIKEAYRLNKHILDTSGKFSIVFIYVAKDILSFKEIEKKLYLTLQRINSNHDKHKS